MAKIGLQKGSGKRLKVREKSVKSQGILRWILSGNPVTDYAALKESICSQGERILLRRKEFAPRGSEFFLFRVAPYGMENHFYHITRPPLNVTILLRACVSA